MFQHFNDQWSETKIHKTGGDNYKWFLSGQRNCIVIEFDRPGDDFGVDWPLEGQGGADLGDLGWGDDGTDVPDDTMMTIIVLIDMSHGGLDGHDCLDGHDSH